MDCGNGTMNEHMRKALKVGENPTIAFKLTELRRGKERERRSRHAHRHARPWAGRRRPITVPATGVDGVTVPARDRRVRAPMTDYDLKPPSLMFGRIKVGETVTVKFDLLLKS